MHINEQSPRTLRRQLRKHFPHVLLWFGSPVDPLGSLGRKLTPRELAGQRDLFAIASFDPVDPAAVTRLFASKPLQPAIASQVFLESGSSGLQLPAGESINVPVVLRNDSADTLNSYPRPNPVHFGYHWLRSPAREMALYEGATQPAPALVRPTIASKLRSDHCGTTRTRLLPALQITLVQEGVFWFDNLHAGAVLESPVEVT